MKPEQITGGELVAEASADASLAWLEGFVPRRFLRNGHLQTLAGNFLPRRHPALPAPESRLIEVEAARPPSQDSPAIPASHVLCHCHWQPLPQRGSTPTLIILHGLEGSSSSQYVVGNAARAWAARCNVVRMNMRNCGGTENMSPTLYHSGFSIDVRIVMETFVAEYDLAAVALVGYSMGGNLVLKLAGELNGHAPAYLKAVVGVSPAMDLAASADALHEPWNRVYEWKFLRGLSRRYRRKAALFPHIYRPESIVGVRTLREFDDRITAAYSGFTGADDYYARSSSAQYCLGDRCAYYDFACAGRSFRTHAAANARSPSCKSERNASRDTARWSLRVSWSEIRIGADLARRRLLGGKNAAAIHPAECASLMETNISAEAGADDPIIVVPWTDPSNRLQYVEPRSGVAWVDEIVEARDWPEIRQALLAIHSGTLVFTVKCDAWVLSESEKATGLRSSRRWVRCVLRYRLSQDACHAERSTDAGRSLGPSTAQRHPGSPLRLCHPTSTDPRHCRLRRHRICFWIWRHRTSCSAELGQRIEETHRPPDSRVTVQCHCGRVAQLDRAQTF